MHRLVLGAVALAVALRVSSSPAQQESPAPEATKVTATQIVARMLQRNQERLAALERYESDRTYRVEYHGTGGDHHAEIRVHAEYAGPSQKHFTILSETGPRFLCDKVLRKLVDSEQEATSKSNRTQMALSPENYIIELAGEEVLALPEGPESAWILQVTPRIASKFSYRGRVWISQSDYGVIRIAGEPAKSPSWWIDRAAFDSRYTRRGDLWLPERNLSTSHVRIGGQATLTIDYGAYPVLVAAPLKGSSVQIAAAAKPLR